CKLDMALPSKEVLKYVGVTGADSCLTQRGHQSRESHRGPEFGNAAFAAATPLGEYAGISASRDFALRRARSGVVLELVFDRRTHGNSLRCAHPLDQRQRSSRQ